MPPTVTLANHGVSLEGCVVDPLASGPWQPAVWGLNFGSSFCDADI